MPFQDSEDIQIKTPRAPSAGERWLRRIFIEDFNLKLLALGITFVLWFAVTGQKQPMSKRITVPFSFVHADDMEISNDPPRTVDITLTASSDKLTQINSSDLMATVMVSDHTTGDHVVRLSRDRVRIENLPSGVQIDGFQPAVISVRLEPVVKNEVNVEITLEGKVAEGYEVTAVTSSPARVRVRGPASHVNSIEKAPTESVSLEGRKASFDLNQVAINIPDQKVDVLDSLVQVHVEIRERTIPKPLTVNGLTPQGGGEADKPKLVSARPTKSLAAPR